ncbi:MAG: hypothetical protein ACJ75P_06285 [Gaiellaceae bacterium]
MAVGLAFAALVVPAGGQAKPTPGRIPFKTDQQLRTNGDDAAYWRAVSRGDVYIPLQGSGITSSNVSGAGSSVAKAEPGGNSSNYAVTAFALVLLVMTGITLLVWRNRKGGGRLSPA